MKIIKVESCLECPRLEYIAGVSYRCSINGFKIIIKNRIERFIHCLCPLQSKENLIQEEIKKANKKLYDFMESAGFKKVLNKSKGDI